MIDTTKIKNHWNAMASGTVVYLDVERDTVFKLCDYIDELERKLNVAIETMECEIHGAECDYQYQNYCVTHNNKRPCNQEILKDALKQIRGE